MGYVSDWDDWALNAAKANHNPDRGRNAKGGFMRSVLTGSMWGRQPLYQCRECKGSEGHHIEGCVVRAGEGPCPVKGCPL